MFVGGFELGLGASAFMYTCRSRPLCAQVKERGQEACMGWDGSAGFNLIDMTQLRKVFQACLNLLTHLFHVQAWCVDVM